MIEEVERYLCSGNRSFLVDRCSNSGFWRWAEPEAMVLRLLTSPLAGVAGFDLLVLAIQYYCCRSS